MYIVTAVTMYTEKVVNCGIDMLCYLVKVSSNERIILLTVLIVTINKILMDIIYIYISDNREKYFREC